MTISNYIEDNKYIKNESTDTISNKKRHSNYERKNIIDTSLYKKYEALKIEKWKILLR